MDNICGGQRAGVGERRFGLSDEQVESSRRDHGANVLARAKRKSFFRSFVENLGDPVIKILLCALAVNIVFMFRDADWFETAGIALSVFLATLISTASEYGSAAAFARLSEESEGITCRVRRVDGKSGRILVKEIPMTDVVVGDVALLSAGGRVPADGALISGRVGVDQSGITGESRQATKLPMGEFCDDASHRGSLFGGCTVLSGEGEMEVRRVGEKSFIGEISKELQTETRKSPLKLRLTTLAKQISVMGYIAAGLCALAYIFNSFVIESGFSLPLMAERLSDWRFIVSELIHALTLGLTVVVMAVPEGLPMMIAVVLSSNIKRMVRDNVLVRKPVGIEAAGSMNILFTDKTGTLTEGKMTVGEIALGDGERFKVSSLEKKAPCIFELYRLFCFYGGSGNDATLGGGNPTEAAMNDSARGFALPVGYKAVEKQPFDSAKKYSAARLSGKKELTLIKGAPEVLLPHISGYMLNDGKVAEISRDKLEKKLSEYSSGGLRVLALAVGSGGISSPDRFGKLVFVGAVLISDRLRVEAAAAVRELKGAGIQVVMITGDNKDTALAIAKGSGIFRGAGDVCLTGKELARMGDAQLREVLPRLRVVARALPSDKSRLVRVAQDMGLVVGMTGDGVNDAPALKAADIGFSMGSGTQVAKEAGDIIITDNNLSSIVKAVLYGRNIFKSIRKFIVLQLTVNLCAVGVTMVGPFIGIESPVTVIQMLWINMIMDTLGGVAFAGEPPLKSCMKENPKRRDEKILNGYMINQIVVLGAFTFAVSVAFLKSPVIVAQFNGGENSVSHLTAFFAFFIFAGVFNCFNARTDSLDLCSGIAGNKGFIFIMLAVLAIQIAFVYFGGSALRTVPLSLKELWCTMLPSLLVFPADILRKIFWRLSSGRSRGGY